MGLASGKMKETGGKLAVVVGPGRVLDMLKLTQITSPHFSSCLLVRAMDPGLGDR